MNEDAFKKFTKAMRKLHESLERNREALERAVEFLRNCREAPLDPMTIMPPVAGDQQDWGKDWVPGEDFGKDWEPEDDRGS